MEQGIADFLKDTFPEMSDFEQLHFGVDTETVNNDNKPEREAAMEDNNNNKDEDSVSGTESDLDLVNIQSVTNTDMEVKTTTCSRNSKDGLLDEQSMQTVSMLYGSWDGFNSDQAEDQQLSLHEEECKEELKIHADQMTTKQAHAQVEDVGFLEKVPGTVVEEKTSHLLPFQMSDNPEYKSSASEITDPEDIEERAIQNAQDNKELNYFNEKFQDDPTMSTDVQSRDDMKEFTEDDHVREEEGLADYPSDLSQSEEEEPSHMNTKLGELHLQADEEHRFCPMENQDITSRDDSKRKNNLDVEDVCEKYNSNADKDNSRIANTVESVDSENFQSIALLDENSEGYTNEEPDYHSDSSSDEDYMRKKFMTSHEQDDTFAKDVVECEEEDIEDTDSQNVEICDVGGLSDVPAFPEAGMVDSRTDGSSAYSSHSSVSHLESNSAKPDENNTDHDNEVLNIRENLNTLLPETFWSLIDKDSLKLDEYDWDVNADEVICDEEDDFLEEQENEEEMERDWEKESARIDAFNRYYKSFEDEENVFEFSQATGRSHKVTFCLEPKSTLYEEECSSSEEELNTNVSELHPAEHNSKPLDAGENIHNVQPETLWSPTILMDEDNVELNEYDHDIQGEDFKQRNSSEVIYDENMKLFLEEQMNDGQEVKRDLWQEQARTEVFDRCNKDREDEVPDTSHHFMFMDQESSQTEDNESSEQESNTDDTSNRKTEDQSDSDEPQGCTQCFYPGRQKLQKHLQKLNKTQKEPKSKCLVLLKSVLGVSLATVVGALSYWWATDSLDWIY